MLRVRTLPGAIVVIALLLWPLGSVALAQEVDDGIGPEADISSLDAYVEMVDTEVEAAAEGSAYCYGRTGVPFKDAGYAKAKAKTACTRQQRYVYVYSELWRARWYGWQFLDSKTDDCTLCRKANVTTAWPCRNAGTYTYVAVSDHYVVTKEGAELSGRTGNHNRFRC